MEIIINVKVVRLCAGLELHASDQIHIVVCNLSLTRILKEMIRLLQQQVHLDRDIAVSFFNGIILHNYVEIKHHKCAPGFRVVFVGSKLL